MKLIKLFCLLTFLWCGIANAGEIVSIVPYSRHTQDNLFETLLEIKIKDGWHIFAPYEQEFGSPLKVVWRNVLDDDILEESFSKTKHFDQDDFSFEGYEKAAYYKATVKTKSYDVPNKLIVLWQACAEECISGQTEIMLPIQDNIFFEDKISQITDSFLSVDYQAKIKFWQILLMAFSGGVILNLMPCIFPVLGLKILSLAQMNNKDRKIEAAFYSIGVIVSMLAVAVVLFCLRSINTSIGWGFHLQSPWFIGFMLVVFVILTLLMLDIISISGRFLGTLAFLHFENPKVNAFMTGLLAVLIATPCTAPFMGAAIAYALMAPVQLYFPVFLCLGIGYSLPFTFIALDPFKMRKILPKPGNWMNVLKKIFSLPLIFTCIWLLWILSAQLGLVTSGKNLEWLEYSEQHITKALDNKRPVFIDFTAKWCITCLVNKQAALQSDELAKMVKDKNILLLRADATNQDDKISNALKYYGRASVPLYVYYDGKSDDYLILPQILTPSILKDYLQ